MDNATPRYWSALRSRDPGVVDPGVKAEVKGNSLRSPPTLTPECMEIIDDDEHMRSHRHHSVICDVHGFVHVYL